MRSVLSICSLALLFPASAYAQATLSVGAWGGGMTVDTVVANIVNVLINTAGVTLGAIFLIGAFFFITSGGAEDRKSFGKGMMIAALIGAAIIAGARGIMNTTLYFIYS